MPSPLATPAILVPLLLLALLPSTRYACASSATSPAELELAASPLLTCLASANTPTILPSSPEYPGLAAPFNTFYDSLQPLAIVPATSTAHVQAAVSCCRATNTTLRIRGGGHSYAGFSAADNTTLLLDLQQLDEISVQPPARVVVEGGARLGNIYKALSAASSGLPSPLALPGGTCPHVGVGGHAQGGGFGYISRSFGMLSDRMTAVWVVLANASLVQANATAHADLFWALRGGGGGSFGVVVKYAFDAVTTLPASVVRFNATLVDLEPASLLASLQESLPAADRRLNIAIGAALGLGVTVDGHWLGPRAELDAVLETLPTLAALPLKFHEGPFYTLNDDHGPNQNPHAFVASSHWIYAARPLPSASLRRLFEAATLHLRPFWGLQFHAYGPASAVNAVPANATAFPYRNTLWSIQAAANFKPEQADAALAGWARFHAVAVGQVFDAGAYRCYPDALLAEDDFEQAYWAGNVPRLRSIKRAVDPDNFFRFSQSVRTA